MSNTDSEGRLFVLCGPTAVGKGTVVGALSARYPGRFHLSISATTRDPRPEEVEGESYFFVSEAEFLRLRDSGQMLEWAQVHGTHYYGTPCGPVDAALAEGLPVLLEIDLEGARQVKKQRPGARMIFMSPPSWEELVTRLAGRDTESPEEQARRLQTAKQELVAQDEFDEIIVNDVVENTARQLAKIMGLT